MNFGVNVHSTFLPYVLLYSTVGIPIRSSSSCSILSTKMGAAAAITLYSILGVACFYTLATTLWAQPLFPLQLDNLEWMVAWLKMTVLDYYGAAIPLCGVAISSENGYAGWLWSIGFCLGGSPFCCAYVMLRMLAHGEDGLRLRF